MYFPVWKLRKWPGRSTGIRGRNCAASPFRKPDGCRAQASAEISGIGALQTKKWLLLITSRAGVHSSVFFCYDPRVQQAAGSKRGIEHRQGFRDPHGIPNRVNAAQPAEQAGQCKSRLPPLAFPGLLGKRLKKRCSRVLFIKTFGSMKKLCDLFFWWGI